MKTIDDILTKGILPGEQVYFEDKELDSIFVWKSDNIYTGDDIYLQLAQEGLIEIISPNPKNILNKHNYVAPESFMVYEKTDILPVNLEEYSQEVTWGELSQGDQLRVEGEKINVMIVLTPESYRMLNTWLTFPDVTPEEVFSLMVKSEIYRLYIKPRH